MEKIDSSCWNCGYRKGKQISLFGVCLYFLHIGKEAKEIPSNIVDKGCKHYMKIADDKNVAKVISTIIELFHGELLKKEKVSKKLNRKKKYYKSKHKYGERKDW